MIKETGNTSVYKKIYSFSYNTPDIAEDFDNLI